MGSCLLCVLASRFGDQVTQHLCWQRLSTHVLMQVSNCEWVARAARFSRKF